MPPKALPSLLAASVRPLLADRQILIRVLLLRDALLALRHAGMGLVRGCETEREGTTYKSKKANWLGEPPYSYTKRLAR